MERPERETVSSAITVKTDTGSKVLPGDKRGLPYEIWAIILSYLPLEDLCRSALVCKTWNEVVQSLDHTKWRDLYLSSSEWRHPSWPLNLHSDPRSWRLAYKEQYLASSFWTQISRNNVNSVTCMPIFKRSKLRKTITVGTGKDFESLKGALEVANDYDRIMVYPGIYDEQFEMSSKIPFELIGVGELGSVILVVCIEQTALTGRINNLVFRAPWFTNFILKVRSGYLQVDNCIMEDGMVYVQNPGSIAMRFCTFRHATIILQHVNASIIQNCEFSQTDSAAVTVEGYPKEDKNWTFRGLNAKIMSQCWLQKKGDIQKNGELLIPKSAYSLSTATTSYQKSMTKTQDRYQRQISSETELNNRKMSHDFDLQSHDPNHPYAGGVVPALGEFRGAHYHRRQSRTESNFSSYSRNDGSDGDSVSDKDSESYNKRKQTLGGAQGKTNSAQYSNRPKTNKSDISKHQKEKIKQIENFVTDCARYSNPGTSGESTVTDNDDTHHYESDFVESHLKRDSFLLGAQSQKLVKALNNSDESEDNNDANKNNANIPPLDLHSLGSHSNHQHNHDNQQEGGENREEGQRVHRSLSSSEVSLHTASSNDLSSDEEEGGGAYNSDGQSRSSSSSSDDESLLLSDHDSEFSSSEESVIMLTYPERHQPRSLSAQKECTDVASINSQNQSEHIDIIQDNDMKTILNEVRGCFIHKCRITQSKGAVMVSLQSHAIIMECEINSVGYGIRCIQNSRTVVLKNEIHHCRTSGVYMRLSASGLITGNDIHSNCEAGIDIRKNADPIVQCNRIHHGKRSGIVVLGSGRGQIRHNDIYQNKEAGVYILFRGNPTVSNNQVYSGKAAGIAINEGGRGYIHGNTITGNQWGGIDIRHGGDPVIHHNTVCNGVSDGIVIGEGGKGSIQNNIITGNAGCGIWVMAAHQPLIHSNEIHSNRDSGISLVNRMDSCHRNETLATESKDTPSQNSIDFLSLVKEDTSLQSHRQITMTTIEYNKVFNNEGKGISVQFGEAVLLQSNFVYENKCDGITIDQTSPVTLKNNCVTLNFGTGVKVVCQSRVSLLGNGIYDNKENGIWCQSEADITENDILGNNWSAIHLKHVTAVKVCKNRLHASNGHIVSLTYAQDCTIEDNIFYGSGDKTITHDEASLCTTTSNDIQPVPERSKDWCRRRDQLDISPAGTSRWMLTNPTPRPCITPPPSINNTHDPHTTSITRVTLPAQNCEQGSKLCVIL